MWERDCVLSDLADYYDADYVLRGSHSASVTFQLKRWPDADTFLREQDRKGILRFSIVEASCVADDRDFQE